MKNQESGLRIEDAEPHWATRYIGLPWENGAQGPDAFDCWALVRHVQREHYGLELPIINVDADDLNAVSDAFENHPEKARWQRIVGQIDGDCVLTHKGNQVDHVGIYLDIDGGRVLHAVRGSGVVCTALPVLKRMGWHPLEFYRFRHCEPHSGAAIQLSVGLLPAALRSRLKAECARNDGLESI